MLALFASLLPLASPVQSTSCGGWDGTLGAAISLGSSGPATSACFEDFDGDGLPDVALSIPSSPEVRVYFGRSGRRFSAPVSYPLTGSTGDLIATDLSGDGVIDLATTNSTSGVVSILFGLPGGQFEGAVEIAAGQDPRGLASGDVNGDGSVDVLVANGATDSVTVLAGTGGGGFSIASSFAVGDGPIWVRLRDMTGDGILDAVVGAAAASELQVWTGTGTGGFVSGPVIHTTISSSMPAIGDIDGDGLLDVVTPGSFGAGLFINTGSGSFSSVSGPYIFNSSQNPTFTCIALGDLDGNGALDIVASDYWWQEYGVVLGLGGGTFAPSQRGYRVSTPTESLEIADADGDGFLDCVSVGRSVDVMYGTASGSLEPALTTLVAAGASGLAVGDWDRDGCPDLAVACRGDSSVRVLVGDGAGQLLAGAQYLVGVEPVEVKAVDVDLDGDLDLVVTDGLLPEISTMLNDGTGAFSPAVPTTLPGVSAGLVVSDLDHDGATEVVTSDPSSGEIRIFEASTGVGLLAPVVVSVGPSVWPVGAADFTGDGIEDLCSVVRLTPFSWTLRVGVGSGSLAFPTFVDSTIPTGHPPLAILDADGDGVVDVAYNSESGGDNFVSLMRGAGGGVLLARYGCGTGGEWPVHMCAADFNNDGTDELVVARLAGELNVISCPSATSIPRLSGKGVGRVLAHDLDRDGVLDIVGSNAAAGEVHVWLGGGGVNDDDLAPNWACQSARVVSSGIQEDLVVHTGAPDDFFAIDVLDGDTLTVDVLHNAVGGNIDCFLYDASTLGSSCGDGMSSLTSGVTGLDDESLSWTNDTGVTQTYLLQVSLVVGQPGVSSCNNYDLQVAVGPAPVGVPICAGDGTLIDCPCDNESSDGESGCLNATGMGAKISASGSSSILADDAVFHLSQARVGQPSLLIQGWTLTAVPFKDGILCMGNPTKRLEVVLLNGAGEGSTTSSIVTEGSIPGPGVTRHYQFWYRDPALSPCGTGSNFSNGLTVQWAQ